MLPNKPRLPEIKNKNQPELIKNGTNHFNSAKDILEISANVIQDQNTLKKETSCNLSPISQIETLKHSSPAKKTSSGDLFVTLITKEIEAKNKLVQ